MINQIKKHKSASWLIVIVLALVFALAIHLARDKNKSGEETAPPGDRPTGLIMSDPPDEVASPLDTSPYVGDNILERRCDVFNFENLSVGGLGKLLQEEFGLALECPATARALKVTALERGGDPLGEILAQLFMPYHYAYYRQGKTLQILSAEFGLASVNEHTALRREFRATVQTHWSEPFDLWIDLIPPLNLRVETQPLFGETEERAVALTVEGRRSGRVWFRHSINAPLGEISHVEAKGKERLRVLLTPKAYDETNVTLDVALEHETPIPVE